MRIPPQQMLPSVPPCATPPTRAADPFAAVRPPTTRSRRRAALAAGLAAVLAGCGATAGPDDLAETAARQKPPATRQEEVLDSYHGTTVRDPYRWLEDQDSAEVLAWADRQNEYTEAFLSQSGRREAIRARLTELWNFPRYGPPGRRGDVWVYTKNDGLQNQSVLYKAPSPSADGEVLLDPNTLSQDGTVALASWSIDEDGRHMAYATSTSGSDWRDWHVLEVATGRRLDDELKWTKFTNAAWTHDGQGFFYQRYPAPEKGQELEARNVAPQLCYHVLGTDQPADQVVYERPDQPEWGFDGRVTEDGRYLVIRIWQGSDTKNRIAVMDLEDREAGVQPMLMDFDASYAFVGNDEGMFYFLTDLEAPLGRVVAIPLDDAARADRASWREVIPQGQFTLESVRMIADQFVAVYLHDAQNRVARFGLDGQPLGQIELPGVGSVWSMTGRRADRQTFFSFESFTTPASVFGFDFDSGERSLLREPALRFDPDAYEVRQVALQSKDSTRLLMFIVHKKKLRLDGQNPTYLYGYGGFDISMTPFFTVENLVWLEMGGIYAQVTLRGGGEFGETWHEAGMLKNKQNVFDDFVAAAEYLQRNDFTSRDKLAIGGASNGGLLVGAVLTQRPELIGAAVPEVGVLDMLRYHHFTIGWAWASEYGTSDDAEMFPVLKAYSPLHNIEPGSEYPPTLIMTSDHDDRVLPGHSYKFAAELQGAQAGRAPILLRVTRKAGHGGGKPVDLQIAEATDRLTFLAMALGVP